MGEETGDESDGVSTCRDVVVLELDRECVVFVFEDRLAEMLVIARKSLRCGKERRESSTDAKERLLCCPGFCRSVNLQ